jgi:hypothetical protein
LTAGPSLVSILGAEVSEVQSGSSGDVSSQLITLDRVSCGRHESDEQDAQGVAIRALLLLAGIEDNDHDDAESGLQALEDFHLITQPQNLSTGLIRLLSGSASDWVLDPPWRGSVAKLLPVLLNEKERRALDVTSSLQSHDFLRRIASRAHLTEEQFRAAVGGKDTPGSFKDKRQRILRCLNSDLGRVILKPLLPENLVQVLGELAVGLESYDLGVSGETALEARDNVLAIVVRLQQECEEYPTEYSGWVKDAVCHSLRQLLDEDFSASPVAQDTILSLGLKPRLFPLHSPGAEIYPTFLLANAGPGFATAVELEVIADGDLEVSQPRIVIERIPPGHTERVTIPCKVVSPMQEVMVLVDIQWKSVIGHLQRLSNATVELRAQPADIDWDKLESSRPYALSPVQKADQLAGRKETMNQLLANVINQPMTSMIIWGQKRIGKTSVARALTSLLKPSEYLVVFTESGEWLAPDPVTTIEMLGERICKLIRKKSKQASAIEMPHFAGALSPLTDFLEDVFEADGRRIVIVVDEFDELPLELYSREPVADAFFQTLRSLSSKDFQAFLMIGGEKIAHVLDMQGQKLNKWEPLRIDYFDDVGDFRELVEKPVSNTLRYEAEAIGALFATSGGNPYFAKLVCSEVFKKCVERRDCYVTDVEVGEAVDAVVRSIEPTSFQHFWEDGILEAVPYRESRFNRRKRVLIAVSDALRVERPATLSMITKQPVVRGLEGVEGEVLEFVNREVLLQAAEKDRFDFKVPLFGEWLDQRGIHDLILSSTDLAQAETARAKEEELRVKRHELERLARRWGYYRDAPVDAASISSWLSQFGDAAAQRAIFKMLLCINFLSSNTLRELVNKAEEKATEGSSVLLKGKQRKRGDICIVPVGGIDPGKAAKAFAEKARVYRDWISSAKDFAGFVQRTPEVETVLFLTDWLGPREAVDNSLFGVLKKASCQKLARRVRYILIALVADANSWQDLGQRIHDEGVAVDTFCARPIPSGGVFGHAPSVRWDGDEKERARELTEYYGALLNPIAPLGDVSDGLAIVLEYGCPLESLPVLWHRTELEWQPLFPRSDTHPMGVQTGVQSEEPRATLGDGSLSWQELLQRGEGNSLEYRLTGRVNPKTSKVDSDVELDLSKAIAGFLNSDGGTLLIGVDHEGNPVGCSKDMQTMTRKSREGFENWLTTLMNRSIGRGPSMLVRVGWYRIERRDIARIDVSRSQSPVFVSLGEKKLFLVRRVGRTRLLTVKETNEYIRKNWP